MISDGERGRGGGRRVGMWVRVRDRTGRVFVRPGLVGPLVPRGGATEVEMENGTWNQTGVGFGESVHTIP